MNFTEKVGVLLRDPRKAIQFCQYSSTRLFYGHGIAKIPFGAKVRTSSFSEYLSVYGLMPDERELAMIRKFLTHAKEVHNQLCLPC
jgi:hypothetical protein